jgi:hypothetical protein
MTKKNSVPEHNTLIQTLELALAKAIPSTLERLFPPADAPVDAVVAAQQRTKSRVAEVPALLAEVRRHLANNRRRLLGQSTPKFKRASEPDVRLPIPIEDARALEQRSTMAQSVLQTLAKKLPSLKSECDTVFQLSEKTLLEVIQLTWKWVSPSGYVSTEKELLHQEQWMPEVTALLKEERLLSAEIGRHRRLLSEESRAWLEWEDVPDVLIPTTLDEEHLPEWISRHVQEKSST